MVVVVVVVSLPLKRGDEGFGKEVRGIRSSGKGAGRESQKPVASEPPDWGLEFMVDSRR